MSQKLWYCILSLKTNRINNNETPYKKVNINHKKYVVFINNQLKKIKKGLALITHYY